MEGEEELEKNGEKWASIVVMSYEAENGRLDHLFVYFGDFVLFFLSSFFLFTYLFYTPATDSAHPPLPVFPRHSSWFGFSRQTFSV